MDATPQTTEDVLREKPLVVVVQGSPRSDGNCAALAIEAFETCETAGLEVVIVSACALMSEAMPCDGCMQCVATGQCVHDDEMSLFVDMLDEASGLVWLTPVYFSSLPAGLKALIDRMQIFWARRQRDTNVVFHARRPAAALVVGSGNDPFGTQAVTLPLMSVSNIAEFTLEEPTVLSGLEDGDALLRAESAPKLEIARQTIQAFAEAVIAWDHAEIELFEELVE